MNRMTAGALLIGVVLVSVFGCTAKQARGEVTRQVREVTSFDRIHLINGGQIVLVQDDEFALAVETRTDALERVRTEVNGGVLELDFESDIFWLMRTPRTLVYHIRTPRLSGIEISGRGRFETESLDVDSFDIDIAGSGEIVIETLRGNAITVDVAGSGKIAIDAMRGNTIDVDINGSGRFELGGRMTTQTIAVSGSGRYEATKLASRDVTVLISGSGRARVDASDTLDVDIRGSGRVEYTGNPRVNSRITGSGSIRAASN